MDERDDPTRPCRRVWRARSHAGIASAEALSRSAVRRARLAGPLARPPAARLHAHATASRDRLALRAREREGVALARARGICVRKGAGRADDRLCDEAL